LYQSESAVKIIIEQIAQTTNVHFTNEGFEVLFTSNETNQKEIAERLKKVFSNVEIKGRKIPRILVNKIWQTINGIRITEVMY